jgi:hypothetical protein
MHNFVVCLENTDYEASLETRKIYEVVADPVAEKRGFIRVVDESGEDYLFPQDLFVSIPLSGDLADKVAKIA